MRKLTPARVSYRDDFFISYRVYIMTESLHISLFEGTLHGDKIHVRFQIANVTHALPVPVYQQTDFTPKRVVVSPSHDTFARLHTAVKFPPPGTTTGVNSRRADSHRHDILRWYHVDKCRATRRNKIFGLKEEEEDLLTVIRGTNSLPRLQNTCRFAIAFIFSQPATARKNNSFLTRSCDLDFFYKNTMTGASAVISNADFLHLKQATKFSTVNEALSLFF